MRKQVKIIFVLLLLISLTGCKENKVSSKNQKDLYSYNQYKEIFSKMMDNLKFNNYIKIEETSGTNFIFIDKEMSLGKREVLTKDGKQSDTETQERIVYKNKINSNILYIDIIFLRDSIGDDMIYLNEIPIDTKKYKSVHLYDNRLLSRGNLLFQMTLISTNGKKLAEEDIYEVNVKLANYIKKIKKP